MPPDLIDSLAILPSLFWLLLPIAAASGWWLARHGTQQHDPQQHTESDYVKGLNYLLDDQPDQALEILTRLTETHGETIESQLVLGCLFRRRGETDRAIYIHHGLLTRATLSDLQRQRVLLELGEDYARAGLLDRAEALYQTLLEFPLHEYPSTEYHAAALNTLITIYVQEKDWEQAVAHCDRLERMTGQILRTEAAQYCCELARTACDHHQPDQALVHLREALRRNPACARANLMLASLAMARGDDHAALQALYAIEHQNIQYLHEALAPLTQCHDRTATSRDFLDWLQAAHERYGFSWLAIHLAQYLAREQGTAAALAFMSRTLENHPSFMGLRTWLDLHCREQLQPDLEILFQASRRLLNGSAQYRCTQCGFTSKTLHWQCPSCKRWETVYPLSDLICRIQP